jgi:predicted transcriptional regulator
VGLVPAQADCVVEIVLEWTGMNDGNARAAGQIVRTVVAADEPAGKPIRHCKTLEVRLTVDHRFDTDILARHGTEALRRTRILRYAWEAYEQGGLLSYEDLMSLLVVDASTIKRQVAKLRDEGFIVPTRGVMHDMGRAPSHKELIGRLLCRGYTYTEITAATGHSEGSIERYALDLGRVIALAEQGAARNDIRLVCDLSETAVDCYLALYEEHNTDEFRQHLVKLKLRFESGKGVAGPGQLLPSKPTEDPLKRLQERNFPQAVSRLLQEMLNLTEPVANVIAEKVAELDAQTFANTERLKPGQTIMLVETASSAPKFSGQITGNRPLKPIVVSPWTADKIEILRSVRSPKEKRALIADAIAREAVAQGGTSSVDLLGLLLNTSSAVMASALSSARQTQQEPTPIKGITEDAGATLTHKENILDLQDQGYTPPEISRIALHSPESRDRYLKTNLRVETLIKVLDTIPDDVRTARYLGIQRSVVRQYLKRQERIRSSARSRAQATAAPTESPLQH